MAKKKKKGGPRRTGRRRVGAINLRSDTVKMAIGAIGANLATRFIASAITKALPTTTSPKTVGWIIAGGELIGGYMLGAKSKNPIMKGAAIGLMAAGGGQALTNAGVSLSGIPVMIPNRGMVGRTRPMLNGMTPNGGFPTPARVGNAINSFPTPSRVGRMNRNYVAAGAMM